MIGSLASGSGGAAAARIFRGEVVPFLPFAFQPAARRSLRMLAAAADIADLGRATGHGIAGRTEDPDGSRSGQHSLLIKDEEHVSPPVGEPAGDWQIYFTWFGGAFNVEIE